MSNSNSYTNKYEIIDYSNLTQLEICNSSYRFHIVIEELKHKMKIIYSNESNESNEGNESNEEDLINLLNFRMKLIRDSERGSIRFYDTNWSNPIHIAVSINNGMLLKIILDNMPKDKHSKVPMIDHQDNNGNTPLDIAIKNNYINSVRVLRMYRPKSLTTTTDRILRIIKKRPRGLNCNNYRISIELLEAITE